MKKLSVSMTPAQMWAGLIYLAFQFLLLPYILMLVNLLSGSTLSEVQTNFIYFCVEFLFVTLIFHKFLLESTKAALKKPWICLRYAFLGLMLYWLVSLVVNNLIVVVYPEFYNVNDASLTTMTKDNYALMAIGTVVLVPVAEETLFRGMIFRFLYERNSFLGYTLSALAFSTMHVLGYIGNYSPAHLLLCLIQYLPAGICLAWAYVKADSVWAPILMHITINQIGILSMR